MCSLVFYMFGLTGLSLEVFWGIVVSKFEIKIMTKYIYIYIKKQLTLITALTLSEKKVAVPVHPSFISQYNLYIST